jgi:DNA topoisomerase-3
VEKYTGGEENGKWTMQGLPCFPKEFLFELRKDKDKKVDSGVEKQFGIITELCNREDVDAIVNAGDADREGEIIISIATKNLISLTIIFSSFCFFDYIKKLV